MDYKIYSLGTGITHLYTHRENRKGGVGNGCSQINIASYHASTMVLDSILVLVKQMNTIVHGY